MLPRFGEAPAEIERMIARYDLKPHAAPAIPDNPPPHEGAMIESLPYVVEPPTSCWSKSWKRCRAGRFPASGWSNRTVRSRWASMAMFTSKV